MHHAYRLAFLIVAVGLASLAGCQPAEQSQSPKAVDASQWQAAEGTPAIELVIDYGDGVQKRFQRLPWNEGMTVLDALRSASAHPRGIEFTHQGSGEAALVARIDDLTNESGGEGSRNWLYRVNGKLASKSSDAYTLEPDDVILWKFEKYE